MCAIPNPRYSAVNRRSLDVGRGKIAYWVDASAGSRKPWLFFLPGLTADHTLFDAQMAYFAGKVNCIVLEDEEI